MGDPRQCSDLLRRAGFSATSAAKKIVTSTVQAALSSCASYPRISAGLCYGNPMTHALQPLGECSAERRILADQNDSGGR